jgi:peptidoglycan/LPS O-acetylase OafA/YrhL
MAERLNADLHKGHRRKISKMDTARLGHIDGLRGIAAMIVVQAHIAQALLPQVFAAGGFSHELGEEWLNVPPLNLLVHGQAAVAIFFVLSGYVLVRPFLAAAPTMRLTISTAIRRYLRLTLPILASLAFCWLLSMLDLYTYGDALPVTHALMPDYYAGPIHLRKVLETGLWGAFTEGGSDINPVLWTMRIELIGSFAIFAAGFLGCTPLLLLLIFGTVAFFTGELFYVSFVLGSLLALLDKDRILGRLPHAIGVCLLLIGLLLLSYPYYGAGDTFFRVSASLPVDDPGKCIRIMGSALLIAGAITVTSVRRLLARPFLLILGRMSFSVYLIHFPIILSLGTGIVLLCHGSLGYAASVALAGLATNAAVLLGAAAMTKLVDEPAMKLSRLVGARITQMI